MLQRLLEEAQSRGFVSFLRHIALENLALVVDRPPQIVRLAIDLHEHLIDVPAPVPKAPHSADPLSLDIGRKQRSKPVPPQPNSLVADVDAALSQQILNVP